MMSLAACNYSSFGKRPDRNQVVLPPRQDVSAIGRPAHTHESSVVAVVHVEQPSKSVSAFIRVLVHHRRRVTDFSLRKFTTRKHWSSETTAKCSLSGEKANAVMGPLATDQYETGLALWFVDLTDFLTPKKAIRLAAEVPFICTLLFGESSGVNGASSFSLL